METYQNRGGDSGIAEYEISYDSIAVKFNDDSIYLYNYIRPGQAAVNHMKDLARAGQGLNSFISRTVRKNFFQKLR